MICRDRDGNEFLAMEEVDEQTLAKNEQFTHCLAVVKLRGDYLLGWNKWRRRYEIFGGCVEHGESPRDCIIRECCEELGLESGEYTYLGTMKFLMKPDYFSKQERIEYGGLYGITLDCSIEEIYAGIRDRDEIVKLALYSEVMGKETIAEIDEKLLAYY